MNFFRILGALPQVEALAPQIDKALTTLRFYKDDPRSRRTISTIQRVMNDPDVKDAIAYLQLVVKDPNITAAINVAKQLDQILIREDLIP